MKELSNDVGGVRRLWTQRDVARFFGVKTPHAVRAMIRRGECPEPDFRISGNKPRWRERTVTDWVSSRAGEGASEQEASRDAS